MTGYRLSVVALRDNAIDWFILCREPFFVALSYREHHLDISIVRESAWLLLSNAF